ncbi:MAG: amidohydrolase family protein [Woeseiaceae bacterium]|nr:amidohydrolase family protein [Woeseiaceae bacterium]
MQDVSDRKQPVLSIDEVQRYLSDARRICSGLDIFDIHMHATEVIRDQIEYGPLADGLRSSTNSPEYRSPGLANVRLSSAARQTNPELQLKMSELAFSRSYKHTGPRVMSDQIDLAGVDKAVLLPVAGGNRSIVRQMEIIDECCAEDQRFIAGFSISNGVPSDGIYEVLAQASRVHRIRVLKIHPNLTGIDLSSAQGIARVEAMLRACDRLGLPALLHGGCSPILGDSVASEFSTMKKLQRVDWSLTAFPVVIAHFGVYGCDGNPGSTSLQDVEILREMLDQHEHLYTDTSGVSYDAIEKMLGLVSPERVVFGSDALYVPVFRQLALVMHAFSSQNAPADSVRAVLCENASRVLGENES